MYAMNGNPEQEGIRHKSMKVVANGKKKKHILVLSAWRWTVFFTLTLLNARDRFSSRP
jgi:hypothetical protein